MMSDVLVTPAIDFDALRRYRLDRIRQQLVDHDVALAVVTNPVSLRYAVDHWEYQLFQSRIPTTTLFIPADGPLTTFGASHEVSGVDEHRPGLLLNTFDGGLERSTGVDRLRHAIDEQLRRLSAGPRPRIALDRMFIEDVAGLDTNLDLVDVDPLIEYARAIKSPDEIDCMRHAIAVAEYAIEQMVAILEPGVTEQELLAVIHRVNIANGGGWLDGRMLASGPRTNPWLQEATDKRVAAGELVGLDTDMIGPFGYCADISRTFVCGDEATPAQRRLYRHAVDEVQHNIELIQPGMTFRELSEKAFVPDPEFVAHRYPCLAHGIGMTDEYPQIRYQPDWHRAYDGTIEPNMTLCVESFTGSIHGGEGVKLEQMILVTETGTELLSLYPFDEALLGKCA